MNRDEIFKLKNSDNWRDIYDKFVPIEALQQCELWQNTEILSEVGFACGMLAKVSADDIPKRDTEKEKFLKQKARYRSEAEMLRRRCLELMPNNPTYMANLAYLHYQNAIELKQPKGRRDGSVQREAEEAIKYYDQALAIAPNRIKDFYRKGYLLAEILSETYWKDKNVELAKQKRLDGVQSFQKAIQIWESLDPSNLEQKREYERCRKEYIKSLYSTGSAYYQMIINKWDEAVFALGLRKNIDKTDTVIYNSQDLEYAQKAFQYFHYCSEADRRDGEATASATNGACEDVDKLYSLGKSAFAKYWILSSNGQKKDKDAPEAIKYRDEAEHYLIQALNCPWSKEKQRQKKDYIAERLARLYITKGTQEDYLPYQQAVDTIEKYQTARLDPYIIHTLALALMLLKRYPEAQTKLKEAVSNRFNLDIWTSYFLMGCSLLREGRLLEASQEFHKARQKKETDTLLFGLALIAYKSGKKIEAVELIRRANEINPYRLSIGKYLERWSEGAIRPLTPVQSQSQYKDYSYKILEAEDYTQDMYEAFGYDEGMGISFERYLDTHGYL